MTELSAKDLNEQIVSMRKEVRRAIVYHVHKLTANIKRLRLKKGTEEQMKRNSQKVESLVDEIKMIKSVKLDEVSLLAISNNADYLKHLMNKIIVSPNMKLMAKLGLRDNIQNIVDVFRKKYANFENELSRMLEERNEQKKKKRKKKSKKKKGEDSRFKGLTGTNLEEKRDSGMSDIGQSSDEETETKHLLHLTNVRIPKNVPEDAGSVQSSDEEDPVSVQENVDRIVDDLDRKATDPSGSNVDNFFMTSNNEKYHTFFSVPAKPDKENSESGNKEIAKEGKEHFLKHRKKLHEKSSQQNKYDNSKKQFRKKVGSIDSQSSRYRIPGENNFERVKNRNRYSDNLNEKSEKKFNIDNKRPHGEVVKDQKLHPSWEAKKRMSTQSVQFQGRKVVFDDD